MGFERSKVVCQHPVERNNISKIVWIQAFSPSPSPWPGNTYMKALQRRGRNCVLKNFPDNTVLTVCHFSFFYFPFYFSRPDIFFAGLSFPLYLPLLLAPSPVQQLSSTAQTQTGLPVHNLPLCLHSGLLMAALASVPKAHSHFCLKAYASLI